MFLRELRVRSFRGLRSLRLVFDPLTVVIGENSLGKTSLLDALDLLLGVDAPAGSVEFAAEDFHIEATGPAPPDPIELELRFRTDGEAGNPPERAEAVLDAASHARKDGRRELRLRVRATRDAHGIDVEVAALDREGRPLGRPAGADVLEALRRKHPVIAVSADSPHRNSRADGEASAPTELERRVGEVMTRLVSARGPVPQEEVRAGLVAVGERLGPLAEAFHEPGRERRWLRDVVQTPVRLSSHSGPLLDPERHGSGTRSVALLLLLGGLLEARGERALAPDAEPIVCIEEPETHLHLLLLASIWGLIAGLRAQKVVTTNSPELLSAAPLHALRRLAREDGEVRVRRLGSGTLGWDEMRRVAYHVRVQRGGVFFSRCWLLVEGETEFWLLPELAHQCGCDFAAEGIACVGFAQCGPEPLVKLANDLGIEWHLFADGDSAGRSYARAVRPHLARASERDRVTLLEHRDLEQCLWHYGYADVYRQFARRKQSGRRRGRRPRDNARERPGAVIARAVKARSKPFLALSVAQAAAEPDSPGVPQLIRGMIDTVKRLSRKSAL